VIEFAVDLISQIGLLGAAFLIGIEVVIPPIPSEAILLLTGFNVSLGRFGFLEAIAATSWKIWQVCRLAAEKLQEDHVLV
jgi:membrane protein DedA with SNARE-associated domain